MRRWLARLIVAGIVVTASGLAAYGAEGLLDRGDEQGPERTCAPDLVEAGIQLDAVIPFGPVGTDPVVAARSPAPSYDPSTGPGIVASVAVTTDVLTTAVALQSAGWVPLATQDGSLAWTRFTGRTTASASVSAQPEGGTSVQFSYPAQAIDRDCPT